MTNLTLRATLLITLALPLFAQDYKPTSLPSLGGSHTQGMSMNALGQVVGMSRTANGETHAFIWSRADGMVDLDLQIGQSLVPTDINSSGQIAGFLVSELHAATWSPSGGLQDLGTLGGPTSIAEGINNQGQVVGCADVAPGLAHPFLWSSGVGMKDLDPGNTFSGCAFAINNAGKVTGQTARVINGQVDIDAFIWTQQQGLQPVGVHSSAAPLAINEAGSLAGYYHPSGQHAFFWTPTGGTQDIGRGAASSLNNHDQVVGSDFSAFIWTQQTGVRPVPQLSGRWLGISINDAGQILVRATERSRVMTPAMKVSLVSSPNPSQNGQSVTFTATVTSVQGPPPDGENIVFKMSNQVLATVPLVSGVASFSTASLKPGTRKITARYTGDVNYFPSKSAPLVQVVNP